MQGGGDQVPLMDVLGAGDNLNRLLPAHIHLADPHMIGVFVADHGENPAHHNVFNLRVHPRVGLHLLTKDGKGLHEFLVGDAA